MVGFTHQAADAGVRSVISLAATLSISVGIFNLLPIHPLDGGQMLVAFAEILQGGKRLSMQVQAIVATMGIACLFVIVVSVLFLDVKRLVVRSPSPPNSAQPVPSKK